MTIKKQKPLAGGQGVKEEYHPNFIPSPHKNQGNERLGDVLTRIVLRLCSIVRVNQ